MCWPKKKRILEKLPDLAGFNRIFAEWNGKEKKMMTSMFNENT